MAGAAIKSTFKGKGWGKTGTGPRPTDDLTPVTRDSLFLYQLESPDPKTLNEGSLRVAKICETDQYARSVFGDLQKLGILDSTTGRPDTTKIDRTLVNRIGILSAPKVKELVNMMFFWEEELMRWRILDEEAGEIEGVMSAGGPDAEQETELREKLQVIAAKKRVIPSMRLQDGTLKEPATQHPPPYAA